MIDLGLKDGAKGFVKFSDLPSGSKDMEIGQLVHIVTQGVTSKLIKCSLASQHDEKSTK